MAGYLSRLKWKLIGIFSVSLVVAVGFQNCAPVQFQKIQTKALESVTQSSVDPSTNSPGTDPTADTEKGEIFEMGSSGMSEQPDQDETILLSGSVGSTPAMADASDSEDQIRLATGFHSILTF